MYFPGQQEIFDTIWGSENEREALAELGETRVLTQFDPTINEDHAHILSIMIAEILYAKGIT